MSRSISVIPLEFEITRVDCNFPERAFLFGILVSAHGYTDCVGV